MKMKALVAPILLVLLGSIACQTQPDAGTQRFIEIRRNAGEETVLIKEEFDLLPLVEGKEFADGLNAIHTMPSGLRISAEVKEGKIVDWVITDSTGQRRPSTLRRIQEKPTVEGPTTRTWCWLHTKTEYPDGMTVETCTKIPSCRDELMTR